MQNSDFNVSEYSVFVSNKLILSNLNISLCIGECCVVLGKNGAGKTSLFDSLFDIIPNIGLINLLQYNNSTEKNWLQMKNIMGYSGRSVQFMEYLDVETNIRFISQLYNISFKVSEKKMNDFFEYFSINMKIKKQKFGELSSGEMKLVGLCASVIHDPFLIIWDEPYSGLDVIMHNKLTAKIIELKKKNKILLISSHEMHSIKEISSKILIIDQGKQLFFDTLEKFCLDDNSVNSLLRYISPSNA